ncbi:zinc-dependent alcohol dehydrogenase [Mycolicibacterium fluoranthenivorans]|uniref:L-iditol 2-dehydrogenase n=1 Tax=Mycolicibacterium fluoranthenivorans TaxID=258505 RepID=A0A7X5U1D8_9MYCO|nr:alcohol dehydrogenase catalytic domain-containing protein [Mycolicibacterium fluoranthenivorans]MCV7354782.1 alcohol dehydrogenase catalytic domain-containing protein [Mycolicibacterium fluoranthenivorans]NIH96633.1 L-iditol 2-dehydrogenase [Mycolicibacterium fluoranthenivorans]
MTHLPAQGGPRSLLRDVSTASTRPATAAAVSMPAICVQANGELAVQQRAVPTPGAGELLLRTVVSALCGTDLHRFRGAQSYGNDTDVFGHESVGVVQHCDSGRFAQGDRVLHVPFPTDGKVFAPYQLARETNVVPIPAALPSDIGVFAQQLGTVIYALRNFWPSPQPPRSAFVAGAGPAGLMFIQLLRERGCEQIYVSEPDEHRRRLATSFGAIPDEDGTPPVELSIDASGMPGVRRKCWQRTASFGTVGIYGLPDDEPGDLEVSVLGLVAKNLHLVGAIGSQAEPGLRSFHDALDLLVARRIEVDRLISHRIDLDGLPEIAPRAARVEDGIVKVLVDFDAPTPVHR